MNESKYPKSEAFLARYTLAVQVERNKDVNYGAPVVSGFIVDKTIDDPKAMIDSRRKLVEISYQPSDAPNPDPYPIKFYDPQGKLFRQLSSEQIGELSDAEINPLLNQSWGLEQDSPFARRVGEAMVTTCSMLSAAALIASATGAKPMDVFTDLQRSTMSPKDAALLQRKEGELVDVNDGQPVNSLAAYREKVEAGHEG